MFEQLGFEIEGFGGHTLIVSAVPMPHPRFDAERCLRETLAALTGDREAGAHARHERLAATVACKAAIKAGDALSPGEMRALFVALARHDAARARRPRPLDDRAAHVGRDRAALRPALSVVTRHLRTDGGGEERDRAVARRARSRSRSSAPTRVRSIAASTSAPRSRPPTSGARVPHRGIDVVDADGALLGGGVGGRRRRVDRRGARAGRTPVVVGGTGLYLRALFEGLFDEPPLDAAQRAGARAPSSPRCRRAELRRWCERSIRRARTSAARSCCAPIEIALLTGQRVSDLHRDARATRPRWRPRYLVVDPGPALAERIARGSTTMFDDGWPDEVRALMQTVPADAPAWNATGYRRGAAHGRAASSTRDDARERS